MSTTTTTAGTEYVAELEVVCGHVAATTSGYENAPATALLATQCCCCGRALLDAKSVETGIGPICAKKHGFDVDVDEDARARANKLVYAIAVDVSHGTVNAKTVSMAAELREHFPKLAAKLEGFLTTVRVHEDEDGYYWVRTRFSEQFNAMTRRVRGRRGVKNGKDFAWIFPTSERRALWAALQECFRGELGCSDRGGFVVK